MLASNNLDGYGDGVEVAGAGPLGGEGAGVGGVVPPPALQPLVPVLASLHAGGGGRGASSHQTHEMTVPNEIIGCVIGKGGSKIAEIR